MSDGSTGAGQSAAHLRRAAADGLVQSGQRIGCAIGIAAVGLTFFAQLGGLAGGGAGPVRYPLGFESGKRVAAVLGLPALAIALLDVTVDSRISGRRAGRKAPAAHRPAAPAGAEHRA